MASPVVAVINFQIIGRGRIFLGGAAAGTVVGPYWNQIQITDPSTNFVTFTVDPEFQLTPPWSVLTWNDSVTPAPGNQFATLPIATDVSAGYLALVVFVESPGAPPAPFCPCHTTVFAAPPEPVHESVRIANKVRACTVTPPSAPSPSREITTSRTVCGPALTPYQEWVRQTAAQNSAFEFESAIQQIVVASDPSDNQYYAVRWTSSTPEENIAFTFYSFDASGNLRWRRDTLSSHADSSYQTGDPIIAFLYDPFTALLYFAFNTVNPAEGGMVTQLYQQDPATGSLLNSFMYTEVGTFTDIPPLALTTDGAGTLYLASTNQNTVFVRSMLMDGTFGMIEYWAGLTNQVAAPLLADCYGIHYDPSGFLYLNLTSTDTILGGSRILYPSPLPNTIVVKLTATAITRVWAYQAHALNVTGRSRTSALTILPNHSVRLLYSLETVGSNTGYAGFAHFSPDGVLVERHNLPIYDGQPVISACTLCQNSAGTRLFYMLWQPEDPLRVSFGELTHGGDITWIDKSTTYNPTPYGTSATTGATATDRHFWIAYTTNAAVQDQVQTNTTDTVAVEFGLHECFTITEKECICSPIPAAQNFRTVHHQKESRHILREAVRCPLHFQNRDTGGLCGVQHAAVHASGGASASPYARGTYRQFSRIRGIEEICRPVRGVSGSELTARIASRTVNSNATLRRHAEHFRPFPPPIPCRLYRSGPQPGVPIAPVTPCNLGNQRVDYSAPTK